MKNVAAIAIACALIGASALAIEPPKQDKPPPSTVTPPSAPAQEPQAETTPAAATPPAEAPAAEAEADEETLPPLPADAAAGPSPTRFNPTEKVRADFPVSFPIDI